jgi:hypothetical protein
MLIFSSIFKSTEYVLTIANFSLKKEEILKKLKESDLSLKVLDSLDITNITVELPYAFISFVIFSLYSGWRQ